jgi:hypothetical protein
MLPGEGLGKDSPQSILANHESGVDLNYLPVANPLTDIESPVSAIQGSNFYVSPNGSAYGTGSISKPWNLATALSHPPAVKAGDTIWLMDGTYYGIFNSTLTGSQEIHIIVRAMPDERVTINGSIVVYGQWTTFWGLEIMNSYPDRIISPGEDSGRQTGFVVVAPHVKLINNIIHDTKQGIATWSEAYDFEAYGNIIYNNGYQGTDRGHGHGIYAQNQTGVKRIEENITFNNFGGYGIHIYAESANIKGFELIGNVNFNGDILVGGATPAERISVTDNYSYAGKMKFYYSNQYNNDLILWDNYIIRKDGPALEIGYWQELSITNNMVYSGSGDLIRFIYPSSYDPNSYNWDINHYFYDGDKSRPFYIYGEPGLSFQSWKNRTGFDYNSQFEARDPNGNTVIVRPNRYEGNRAHIIIFNWDHAASINVDVEQLSLKPGDHYILRYAQNYYDEVIADTYNGGSINIPLGGVSIAKPIGLDQPLKPSTLPEFAVLVIEWGTTFLDVPSRHWAHDYIEALYEAGYTSGCSTSPPLFCPDRYTTRAEMAVFILKAKHGSNYIPPSPSGTMFEDVPTNHWAAAWIEQLAREGISSGYPDGTYRPDASVTRAQMAIFLLKARHGQGYTPPLASGTVFTDVPANHWAAAWIEQLYREGITSGYGDGTYRPGNPVTRAEMAVFIMQASELPIP